MKTNFKYISNTNALSTLGTKNGYQHLWKEAYANRINPFTQFTFLNNKTFYTISTLADDSIDIFFTRVGANDPNFNLRREPSYILRAYGKNKTFFNAIEVHGNFNPTTELNVGSVSTVTSIQKLQDNEEYSAFEILIDNKKLLLIQCNKDFQQKSEHVFNFGSHQLKWTGPYYLSYNQQQIQ
jgi:hypothetical protein